MKVGSSAHVVTFVAALVAVGALNVGFVIFIHGSVPDYSFGKWAFLALISGLLTASIELALGAGTPKSPAWRGVGVTGILGFGALLVVLL